MNELTLVKYISNCLLNIDCIHDMVKTISQKDVNMIVKLIKYVEPNFYIDRNLDITKIRSYGFVVMINIFIDNGFHVAPDNKMYSFEFFNNFISLKGKILKPVIEFYSLLYKMNPDAKIFNSISHGDYRSMYHHLLIHPLNVSEHDYERIRNSNNEYGQKCFKILKPAMILK